MSDLGGSLLQLVGFIALALADFFARQHAARNRVNAAHVLGHVAIGDAFDFQIVEAAKICDLRKGEAGIVEQPDGGRLGHQNI